MKKTYFLIFSFILFLLVGCGSNVKIEFETNGGTAVTTITEKSDFDPTNLPYTTKKGYEFGGWFLDEELTESLEGNVPKGLVFKLYAKWNPLEYDYQVEYYLEKLDGTYELEETLDLKGTYGEVVNAELKTYTGFSLNENSSNNTTTIKDEDNDVLKMYYDRNTYNIIFDEDGGEALTDLSLKYGENVDLPTPTRLGYEFVGWENAPTTMPASDVNVKAKWTAIEVDYKVEIYKENADDDGYTLAFEETKRALAGSAVEYTEPLDFLEEEFSLNTSNPNTILEAIVAGDGSTVLKVYYNRARITIEITYNSLKSDEIITVKFGASQYLPDPGEKEGHEFVEWQSLDGAIAETVPFVEKYEVYAVWNRLSYTISFETNADISITSITALFETEITAPSAPVRQGYNFLGWYIDEDYSKEYVFSTMESRNITLYAKWEGLPYTMEFDSNGGSSVSSITAPIDIEITKPIPTKAGYNFLNWYTDPQLTHLYTEWKMPYNGIKLYAKWDEKVYKITFNVNGGSPLNDIEVKYLSSISAPVTNPTKEGYVFDGYYKDPDFNEVFVFDYMPLDGAQVYVKWADVSVATKIANVLKQDFESDVVVKGIVYCLLDPKYNGYFLYDDTGYIYIHAPNVDINVGDLLVVSGKLSHDATISNVVNVEFVSADNQIKVPVNTDLEALYQLEDEFSNYYKYFAARGVLEEVDDEYLLYDYFSNTEILVDYKSFDFDSLSEYEKKYIEVEFAYDLLNSRLIIVDVEEIEDAASQIALLKESIIKRYELYYESGSSFEIPNTDEFGFGSIIEYSATGENASLYDSVNKKFASDIENQEITFTVTIKLDSLEEEFEICAFVGQLTVSTVREFYDGEYGEYLLELIVIMLPDSNGYSCIAKDDTGYICLFSYQSIFRIGDQIKVFGYKDEYADLTCELVEIVAREVDLDLTPTILSPSEFNESLNDLDYGEYVQTTGYIVLEEDEYDYLLYFVVDGVKYPLEFTDYQVVMPLEESIGYPVELRFYLFNYYDDTFLFYAGVRGDLNYPSYNDTEALNAIQTAFSNVFAGKNFYPMETLILPSKDLVYGVLIEYEFSESSKQYYVDGRFVNVEEEVPIAINFTITKNGVTQNFTYNTKLLPLPITPISQIPEMDDDTIIYTKGLVVFKSNAYAVIKDDTGYIRYSDPNNDFAGYKGDYILLAAYKTSDNQEIYLANFYDEDFDIVEIYSRGNDVELDITNYKVSDMYKLDSEEEFMGEFVEISGKLKQESYWYYLDDGINEVRLYEIDDYSYARLSEYLGEDISVIGFKGFYTDGLWYIYYFGDKPDYAEITDEDQVNLIKDYLINHYDQIELEEDSILSLILEFTSLGGSVQYSTVSESIEIIDDYLKTGFVDEVVTAIITAEITVGSVTDTVSFEVVILHNDETPSLPITSISDIYLEDSDENYRLVGTIIAKTYYNGRYYYLVQDDSGLIYVKLPYGFYTSSSDVGKIIDLVGFRSFEMGRTFVETVEYSYLATDSVEVEFTETTFADFYNFDHFGHENIGKPVELSGFLHRNLYITDGYERVYILCTSVDRSSLNNYIGYNVVIKGFYFGNDVNPYIAITNVSSYDPIIEYGEHTDTEKVKKALDDLINDTRYYEYGFEGGEEISTIQSHDIFDECEYIYSIIGDSPAYIEDGVIYFVDANENYQVKVQVEIKCGDASSFYEFNLYVRGYDLDSLDDLFLEEPGTKEIHLVGEVLQIANSYIYLVIEGKVYYLEYDYQYNFYEGDLVHVSGQKSIIDGKVNYSYNIYLDNYYDDYDYLEPEIVVKTISQLYEDPDGDDIKGYIIRVSGTLLYDVHNDFFYLEEEDQRIYIRESNTGGEMYKKAKVSSRYYIDNKTYIDEKVDVYLLFPDKKIYGECMLFDLYNIEMQEMTLEEHIEHAMNDIKRNVENMVFHIGDYVLDAIEPKMIHEDEYYLNCTFDLKNEEDSIYFSEDLNQISIVEVETYVTIIITLYYWDNPSISREFEVDLHLIPYEQSSIHDVLYGVPYEYYMIEGTVQQYNLDSFIILKDDTGVIYVHIILHNDYEIAVGDKFVVYGFRDFYEYSNETPILVSYGVAKNKGAGDPVNNVPEIIDIDGIKAIEYLEPNQHLKYVTFTGKVIFTGNYAYPAHSILENEDMPDLLLGLEGPTYWEFNDMMEENQGKTVRVTGWLMLKSTYSEFMWDLIYDYHIVLDDNN